MSKILVVEADVALADVVAFTLRRTGFDVTLAHNGHTALDEQDRRQPDLIVLAWDLPQLNGLEVCRRVRARSLVPIIMLTVHGAEDDIVAALEAGADDYITKPFSPRQLVARVRAVLRRASAEPERPLEAGPLSLDLNRREARWEGQSPIHLSRLETLLLQALIQNADWVVSAESLMARLWGPGVATPGMLKQVLHRLRRKIEPNPAVPTLIEAIPGIGYVLNTPPETEPQNQRDGSAAC